MTAVDTGPPPAPAPPNEVPSGAPAEPEPLAAPDPWKPDLWRWLALTVLGLAALAVAVVVLDHFVGPVLARARHRELTSDLLAEHGAPTRGQAAGLLQIPSIGLDEVVVEGDRPQDLRAGPGIRVGSPILGTRGNIVITGHAHRWGADFAHLAEVHLGDRVVVQSRLGPPVAYLVTKVERVDRSDVHLLRPSDDHRITLVTGAGGLFSTRRLMVQAVSGSNLGMHEPAHPIRPDSPGPPLVANVYVLALLVALLLAAIVASQARRIGRTATLAIAVAPLVVGALLALLFEVDLLLPALR